MTEKHISRRQFAAGSATLGVGALSAGCAQSETNIDEVVSKATGNRPMMRMTKKELEFITSKTNGTLGGTGTGSGRTEFPFCDGTVVHCQFSNSVRVKKLADGEYVLGVGKLNLPIEAVDKDEELSKDFD